MSVSALYVSPLKSWVGLQPRVISNTHKKFVFPEWAGEFEDLSKFDKKVKRLNFIQNIKCAVLDGLISSKM